MKKTLAFALSIVMILALAVPAFAEEVIGNYERPDIVITSGNADGYNVPGSVIEYEITLHGPNASIIKVGNTTLSISDFKKLDSYTYIYKGSYAIGLTDTNLRFYVYDLYQKGDATFEQVVKFKTDPTRPILNVTGTKLTNGFTIGVLTIAATDNYGIDRIAVNGKTIADSKDIKGRKAYAVNYDVLSVGTYMVVVTDIAGNMSVANVTFTSDSTATVDYITTSLGGNVWAGDYTSGIASLYKFNPQLYYYMRLYGNNKETINDTWLLWYLLNQNNATVQETVPSLIDNPNWFYFYSFVNTNENMTPSEKFLYYSLFSGKLGNIDGSNYLWYLLKGKDFSMNPTLFYYILNGGKNPLPETNINDNFLAYQYFFGDLLRFIYGPELTYTTKDGVMTLTAPAVKEKAVHYQWQKYGDYSWQNVGSDSPVLTVSASAGDKYRVIAGSEFYYRPVASDVLTVTEDMLKDTVVPEPSPAPIPTPVPVPVPADDTGDGEFTSDDIIFNGIRKNVYYLSVKTGEKIVLVPNVNGFWTFDTSMFTGSWNTLAVLTAQKAGQSILIFTGTDGKGHTATRSIVVEVKD